MSAGVWLPCLALLAFGLGLGLFALSLRERGHAERRATTVFCAPTDDLEREVRDKVAQVRRMAEDETGPIPLPPKDALSETAMIRTVEEKVSEIKRLSEKA